MLEEEVYSPNSPIWDQDFMVSTSRTGQLGIQTGKLSLALVKEHLYVKYNTPPQVINSKERELDTQLYQYVVTSK